MAALMLPRAVLTYLKAGVFAALGPEPVLTIAWSQPAPVMAAKQARPQLDDGAGGIEVLPREGRGGGAAKAGDAPELQADGLAFRRGLDRGNKRSFAGRAASAPTSAANALAVSADAAPSRPSMT